MLQEIAVCFCRWQCSTDFLQLSICVCECVCAPTLKPLITKINPFNGKIPRIPEIAANYLTIFSSLLHKSPNAKCSYKYVS